MGVFLKNNIKIEAPAYELVSENIVSTGTTSITISGLNITKEDEYLLVASIYNPQASTARIRPFFNGNNTTTNYWQEFRASIGTTTTAGRENLSNLSNIGGGCRVFVTARLNVAEDGTITWQVSETTNTYPATSVQTVEAYCTSTFTVTSITSIEINSTLASAIGAGSEFRLYKLVAEKVFDTTVSGSAVSYIDITGLSITDDNEYLLTATFENTSATDSKVFMFVNGNTTNTNYYSQTITANTSTLTSSRGNESVFSGCNTGKASYCVANIFVTNGNRFVCQGHTARNLDSAILILDRYATSTFDVSTITSIRVQSEITNALGVGTRIRLYKLK